tara:strand:+ start:1112 stop:1684 length:573 start_codon:yes stop_codon:yes gene_type:complete
MSIMDKIMKAMTDDKGLFQGGEEGRVFGRAKDFMDNRERQRQLMEYDKLDQLGKDKAFIDYMHSSAKGDKSLFNVGDFTSTGRFSSMGKFGGTKSDGSDAFNIEGNMFEYFENNPDQASAFYSKLGDQPGGMGIQNEFLKAFGSREGGGDFLNKNIFPHDPFFSSGPMDPSRTPEALRNPRIESPTDAGY